MKVVSCFREGLYSIVAEAFRRADRRPAMIELGVLDGNNAECLMAHLDPAKTVLVDSWSADVSKGYCEFDQLPPWMLPIDAPLFESYYGGSLSDQATFDRLYGIVRERFAGRPDIEIIRNDTISAFEVLHDRFGNTFDFVYVDANHNYEYVLRDLLYYEYLLAPEGVLMLNDCNHSRNGNSMNLGVLEAVSNFIKRSEFRPVALTNNDGSDLVLARQGSQIANILDSVLEASDLFFVEVPSQLLPAVHVRVSPHGRPFISFI